MNLDSIIKASPFQVNQVDSKYSQSNVVDVVIFDSMSVNLFPLSGAGGGGCYNKWEWGPFPLDQIQAAGDGHMADVGQQASLTHYIKSAVNRK